MKTEGMTGKFVAMVMAKSNADMERAAIDRLDPHVEHHVLEIGFGPGVGIEFLSHRLSGGQVAGADPSENMVRIATRHNQESVDSGKVNLVCAYAHDLPWPDETFDGVVAVNCAQVFDPMDENYREIFRVMKARGRLVTLTHDWAIKRHSESVATWLKDVRAACDKCGFAVMEDWKGTARSGGTVGFTAVKP